ncbi:hypothetical protein J8L73_18440 [Pseudoalteromonas sp. MMG006]|uniref:hypothetical protein n=1 Tax=unclassified Pseudoalteromonas TaxID=194690 RepID=UPI001603574B|nr:MULTISPECIES: hypothetical protein [unclassified Pseudoalteromonas]MBB1419850.1 hypothetical protein [Pseudoalteromonas sp. SG44-1]MBQ4801074.1 hypothetical protein [Pseudoalteromonas sp. MMG006]
MKVKLSFEEIELVSRSLMSHRWKVENGEQGQNHPDFSATARLMDKLAVNHDGAELSFLPNKK